MWVPSKHLATPVASFSGAHSAHHTGIPPYTHSYPAHIPTCDTHVPQQLCWPSPNNLMRRRSVDLLVKGNKNQVDQRDKQLTAVATGLCSHAALVTSLQSCSERIWRGICSTPPAALQAGCTAGPAQKGTPKVCVCC